MNEKKLNPLEANFTIEELFFSRTDSKGRIQSGNSTFQRISEYSWENLISKPHNVIRHSDMPRGVFFLFWEYLNSKKPIVAYVKNRSQSGLFYWVLALAMPYRDEYISFRIKPSSEVLNLIIHEYEKLLYLEKQKKLSPQESCHALLERLQELGFSNYEEFMVYAFMKEFSHRNHSLGRSNLVEIEAFQKIEDLSQLLLKMTSEVLTKYQANLFLPLNIEIQSNSLEEGGASISVIAKEFENLSREMKKEFVDFKNTAQSMFENIKCSKLNIAAILLQKEVIDFFQKEDEILPFDKHTEMQILCKMGTENLLATQASCQEIDKRIRRLISQCNELQKICSGLEFIRMTGKMEVARIVGIKNDLDAFMHSLSEFRIYLLKSINSIQQNGQTLQKHIENLKSGINHLLDERECSNL